MKKLFIFWVALLCSFTGLQAQNNCTDAIPITSLPFSSGPQTTCGTGDDFAAGFSNAGSSGTSYGAGEDYVYSIDITTVPVTYQFALGGSATWKIMSVHSACPPATTNTVGGITTSTGSSGATSITFTTAGTYYIIIDTWPTPNCGAFTLDITLPPPAPNCATLTAPANGSTLNNFSPTLTWDAPTTGPAPTGYRVYTGTTNPPTTLSTTTAATTTTYTATFAAYNTTYYWYVVPMNGTTPATGCDANVWSFTTPAAPSAPGNDDCAAAVVLTAASDSTCGGVVSGTTLGATESMPAGTCSGTPNDDVWYSFVATRTTHIVNLSNLVGVGTNTATDIYWQVLSGSCGATTSLICSDSNTGGTVTGLTVGQTYYVRVYSYPSTQTYAISFDICITAPPLPPSNDECATAVVLTPSAGSNCSSSVSGTTVSATNSNVAITPCAGNADDDVWYSFVATATSHTVLVSNVVSAGSSSSTSLYLQVLSSACGSTPTSLICDTSYTTPTALTGLTVGNTYFVRLYNSNANTSSTTYFNTFDICILTPTVPSNDECATAISLTTNPTPVCASNPVAGSTLGATDSSIAVAPCAGNANDDVWYSFVASGSSHTVTLSNVVSVGTTSSTSLSLQAFSGACGGLTSILCDTSSASAAQLTGLTTGQTYFVRVYNANGTGYANNFSICVTTPPPPPANDECAGAVALTPGANFAQNALTGTTESSTNSTSLTASCLATPANVLGNVWYTVLVPASGNITIETSSVTGSPLTDSVLTVYSDCGTTSLACNDDDGTGNFSLISLTGQTPGAMLYISVFTYSTNNPGQFQISAYDASLGTSDVVAIKDEVTIYPNPFTDFVNISNIREVKSVAVYDMAGRMLKSFDKPSARLNLSQLQSGLYVIKVIKNDGSAQSVKVIKK